ncbi:MAG: hypothetical protein IPO33_18730 [Saprospiraceae bacterium]|nr:hypothetical protein [Candidatus Brachybacter algidus]
MQLNGGNVGGPDQAGIADGQKEAQDIIETSKLSGLSLLLLKDLMKQLERHPKIISNWSTKVFPS